VHFHFDNQCEIIFHKNNEKYWPHDEGSRSQRFISKQKCVDVQHKEMQWQGAITAGQLSDDETHFPISPPVPFLQEGPGRLPQT